MLVVKVGSQDWYSMLVVKVGSPHCSQDWLSRLVVKIAAVAFPNRKSFIFDNKLDFSGIKLAES